MQTEKWNFKQLFEQPLVRWIIFLSLPFLLISTLLFGLRNQYDLEHKYSNIDVCIFSLNCTKTQEQITEDARSAKIDEAPLENNFPTIIVKPMGAAIIAGTVSTGTIVGLVWLGIMALPIELALALGFAIGAGTYLTLKAFY